MRILLVEDDAVFGDGVREGLSLSGLTVDWVQNGRDAMAAMSTDSFSAVILDLNLPDASGLEVLKFWRESLQQVPVLVLTAHGHSEECIKALDLGADDFQVKPVDLDVLEARLRALSRRATGQSDNWLRSGSLSLNRSRKVVDLDGELIYLSAHEFRVLELLMERPGQIVARESVESRLYGWDDLPVSNSLDVLIHKLRKKVGSHRIATIRGLGYRIQE